MLTETINPQQLSNLIGVTIRTIRSSLFGSLAFKNGKLQIFKILLPRLQSLFFQKAQNKPTQQDIESYKSIGGSYVGSILFLLKLEDIMSQLSIEAEGMLKKIAETQEQTQASSTTSISVGTTNSEPTESKPEEPTEDDQLSLTMTSRIEEILGPETQNFVMRIKNIFRDNSYLTKDVQTKKFNANTLMLRDSIVYVMKDEEQNLFIRQLMKMTLEETVELLEVMKKVKDNIQKIRVAIGIATPEELVVRLFGLPKQLLSVDSK